MDVLSNITVAISSLFISIYLSICIYIKLYTLNIHKVLCQLYLNKAEEKQDNLH